MNTRRICLALLLLAPVATFAQTKKGELPRPALGTYADSNDASAYMEAGARLLTKDPRTAADAFYWAARLNPTLADAFYGRRIALLLQDKQRLLKYWQGEKRSLERKDIWQIDSLYLHALTLNPFLPHRFDAQLFDAVLYQIADEASTGSSLTSIDILHMLDRYLTTAPQSFRAWKAYIDGDFDNALNLYAQAAKKEKKKADLLIARSRILMQMGRPSDALPDVTRAVDELRKADKKDFVFLYQSKALTEQILGMIYSRLDNPAAAKEAFARALQEDLSYHPAHVQLAMLALDGKDTATAVSALDLAVQLKSDDSGIRQLYGFALHAVGRNRESEEQLRKAIELNPYYALSFFSLARVLEAEKRHKEAADAYQSYLAAASRNDVLRPTAEERLKVVRSAAQ